MSTTPAADPTAVRPLIRTTQSASVATTLALGIVAALVAAVGIARRDDGFYAAFDAGTPGLVAQDIATLCVGVPLLVGSLVLARRGSVLGVLAWAGSLFYLAYSYFFFVVGAASTGFVAYVLMEALAIATLVALLVAVDRDAVAARVDVTVPVRPAAAFLFGAGLLFAILWTARSLAATLGGEGLDPVTHLVIVADGSVLLPALLVAGWKLWRRDAWGYVLGGILLVKVPLTAGTVAFGTLLAALGSGTISGADVFLAVLFGTMTLASLALLVPFARSVARPPASAPGVAHATG
jgi:hypothetical protein